MSNRSHEPGRPSRRPAGRRAALGALAAALLLAAAPARAQSLEDRLDEDALLRGLIELELEETLAHYIDVHPSADAVRAAQHRIALQRLRLRRVDASSPARLEAIEHLLAAQSDLLEVAPEDPRRAIWLADRAEVLLFDLLPTDAAGLTAHFGRPSAGQRARAVRVAREMDELSTEAETAIEATLLEIEMTPGYRSSPELQGQRRRLATNERDRRIPFLRGVGSVLRAELVPTDAAARTAALEIGKDRLLPLVERLEGPIAARARLYAGLALAGLGQHDASDEQLSAVESAPDALPADVFAARIARAELVAARTGVAAGITMLERLPALHPGDEGLYYRLLIADRHAAMLAALAEGASAAERRRHLRRACAGYVALLETADDRRGGALRALVMPRLADTAGDGLPLEEMPAIVTVARAEALARVPANRGAAIAMLEQALGRPDLDPREDAEARLVLAEALLAAGRARGAAAQLTRVAAEHPTHARSEWAIEQAAVIGQRDVESRGSGPEARSSFAATLEILLTRYPNLPSIDRWRYVGGHERLRAGDFAAALARFRSVAPDAGIRIDARCMEGRVLRAKAEATTDLTARRALNDEAIASARGATRLVGLAWSEADAARKEVLRQELARLRLVEAEAHLDRGRPQSAIEVLTGVEEDPGVDPDVLAGALRLRLDAYRALDRPDEARADIETFLKALPRRAGPIVASLLAALVRDTDPWQAPAGAAPAAPERFEEMTALAELLAPWIDDPGIELDVRRKLIRSAAEAFRLVERFDRALPLYERIIAERPNALEALFGRAECLHGLGGEHDAAAMGIYKRIAGGGVSIGHDYYWQSQLRMLEILDRVQRNTDKILPRIKRLRLEDPELGGERFRRGFQRLENEYARG